MVRPFIASCGLGLTDGLDLRRLKIALAMQEVFLYEQRSVMQDVFIRLTVRYPELDAPCKRILAEWDAQHHPNP